MEQSEITFPYKARYFKLGEISGSTTQCWFILHGQGQLAQYFIKKFKSIERTGTCIIAPEGLSHYYLNGFSGRVGASWMTKENRIMDIDNYINYLNTLYENLLLPPHTEVTILGFSQGAATASRWVMNGNVNFKRLILWGGVFPPDMNFETGQHLLQHKEIFSVNGSDDPFMTNERFDEMRNLAARLNVKPIEMKFQGGHDIDEETLMKFAY
jgi:predicted esterase